MNVKWKYSKCMSSKWNLIDKFIWIINTVLCTSIEHRMHFKATNNARKLDLIRFVCPWWLKFDINMFVWHYQCRVSNSTSFAEKSKSELLQITSIDDRFMENVCFVYYVSVFSLNCNDPILTMDLKLWWYHQNRMEY